MLSMLPPTAEFMGSCMDHAGKTKIAMAMMVEGASLREPLVLHHENHYQPSNINRSKFDEC